jgi:hypothetical protein
VEWNLTHQFCNVGSSFFDRQLQNTVPDSSRRSVRGNKRQENPRRIYNSLVLVVTPLIASIDIENDLNRTATKRNFTVPGSVGVGISDYVLYTNITTAGVNVSRIWLLLFLLS